MSQAARIFPLSVISEGDTGVLAVNLDKLSQAMGLLRQKVFQSLSKYAQDGNHCRLDGSDILISPVAALSIVGGWRGHDEDFEGHDEDFDPEEVSMDLELFLYPLAEIAPNGFEVPSKEPPAKFTLTVDGPRDLINLLEALNRGSETPGKNDERGPDGEGGCRIATTVTLNEFTPSPINEINQADEELLRQTVNQSKRAVTNLVRTLADLTESFLKLDEAARSADSDSKLLLGSVATASRKALEAGLTDYNDAVKSLAYAKLKIERYNTSRETPDSSSA